MLDHLQQPGIAAEKILPEVRAAFDEILLVLSVAYFAQAFYQNSLAVVLDERVPIGAPNYFDYIPTGAAEDGFEFLNDLSVAANWTIQSLQVAVDYENQIVEFLPRSQRYGAERFRLIHFAIAEEGPDLASSRLFEATIFEIFDKASVVNRLNRAEAHGDGGELPEIGHEPGMRIGRKAAAGL